MMHFWKMAMKGLGQGVFLYPFGADRSSGPWRKEIIWKMLLFTTNVKKVLQPTPHKREDKSSTFM